MEIVKLTPSQNHGSARNLPVEQTAPAPVPFSEANGAPNGYYGHDRQNEEEGAINLRELWRRIWRRKWLVLTIVAIVTTLVAIEAARAKNLYQSTSVIEISQDMPSVFRDGDYYVQGDFYELRTAMFLLQSRPLIEDVVANLKLDQDPRFNSPSNTRSIWDVLSRKRSVLVEEPPLAPSATQADFQLDLRERSPEEHKRLMGYVNAVQLALTVKQKRDTRLLEVSFTHTDPEITALVANTIAATFRERVFNNKTTKIRETSSFLSEETRKLEAQMQKADQELADYTRKNGIFAEDPKEDLSATKLAELHGKMLNAQTDRMIKESLYEQVKKGNVAQIPEAFSNSGTTELQKKLDELGVQLSQLTVKFGDKNPKVIEVREQMTTLEKQINTSRAVLAEKIKADFERAVRDENSLQIALAKAKTEAVDQNQTAIQLGILKQKAETAKKLYTELLEKKSGSDVEKAQQSRNVSIAEPAVAGSWVGPPRKRTVLLAFILSLAASIGLVFLLDHLDNRIKTVEDVNRYLRLPALGVIPAIDTNTARRMAERNKKLAIAAASGDAQALAKVNNEHSLDDISSQAIAEAYRMLRTSVLLAAAGRPPKTILFTSSQPGEGKTTTTVNTAICLAQLGAKVLIIDGDMRRPRVHKVFGVKHRKGLSTFLSNEVDVADLIQSTNVPNLYVMPSGLVPPNSADLVGSEKMIKLLQILSAEFDHVLVDSPPVSNVTDPVIMSRLVDGVVMVVHSGKSTRELVRYTRTELTNVGAKIFGVVLNNVNVQQDGYSYYNTRYSYSYGSSSDHEMKRGA